MSRRCPSPTVGGMEITIDGMAHGGDGVGRVDGKAHFVPGAMPGERVAIRVVEDRGNYARAELETLLERSPARIDPPCGHFGACGGCTWQYAAYEEQLSWKREIVAGQLAHLGRVEGPVVRPTHAPGDSFAYRNRMDFRVRDGVPALNRARSHDLEPIHECLLLSAPLRELFADLGPLPGARRVTLRAGINTGDRLVLVDGELPAGWERWNANVARRDGKDIVAVRGAPSLTEVAAGTTFRISAEAFFQVNTNGAEALVSFVEEALEPGEDDTLLDGYGGGGLFSATVGRRAGRVILVESSAASIADAKRNLREVLADRHRIVRGRFESVRIDEYWTLAVVDPPRSGLGREGVAAVIAARPRRIAYVACDPAALARDARLLSDAGYALSWTQPVDLFPQTYHIEAVAAFVDQI